LFLSGDIELVHWRKVQCREDRKRGLAAYLHIEPIGCYSR
jgi:hypothetical protein